MFDQERSNELIGLLGRQIVEDDVYKQYEWTAILLVFKGATNVFGYVFHGDDEWIAEVPDSWDVMTTAGELQKAMQVEGQDPWKKCLVKIARDDSGEVGIDLDFDYDGDKWNVDVADPEGFARSLLE